MKNRKDILWLLIVVAVLAAINVALYFGNGSAAAMHKHMLVGFLDGVNSLSIVKVDGSKISLRQDGGGWRMAEPYNGSVDERVVMRLLDQLSSVRVADVVTDAEVVRMGRSNADFLLDPPQMKIQLGLQSGAIEDIAFGSATPDGANVYARVLGFDAIFAVPAETMSIVDVNADTFRRRAIANIAYDSVTALDIRRGPGSVSKFIKSPDGWSVSGQKALESQIREFITTLVTTEAKSFVWPIGASNESERVSVSLLAGYGLDPESAATITLKSSDGVDCQIAFGNDAGNGLVYALVQNGGAIVMVDGRLKDFAIQDQSLFTDTSLFHAKQESVSFLSIVDGDVLYSLVRDASGKWMIESPISAPASKDVVDSIVAKVLSLTPADMVKENGVSVSISTSTVPVSVSAKSILGDREFEHLRSLEILKIDPLKIKRIVLASNAQPQLTSAVVYDRDRQTWNVEGESGGEVMISGVKQVLEAVNPLMATSVVGIKVAASSLANYGLDAPAFTIAIDQTSDNAVRKNILIGSKTGDGYFATVGSADAVFVISKAVLEKLTATIIKR